ncbi:MAG: hypothetical protein ACI362_02780 [Coriobacteriales bacterium]
MAAFATVTDMRDTARFTREVEAAGEPVQVMKGRERKLVVFSSELFERYERLFRQVSFEAKIEEAEADTDAGRVRPFDEIQAEMKAKYGA